MCYNIECYKREFEDQIKDLRDIITDYVLLKAIRKYGHAKSDYQPDNKENLRIRLKYLIDDMVETNFEIYKKKHAIKNNKQIVIG